MAHRQALAAISAKIIHTTVQPCLTVVLSTGYCCVCARVCVDMVREIIEQRVFFLHESYVK
jgi:hypothetical protein